MTDKLENWKRFIVAFAGLALVLAGGWVKNLDTGAVAIIVSVYVGGASAVKSTANLSTRRRR